jgi:DNA mismatch repair protein MutS2
MRLKRQAVRSEAIEAALQRVAELEATTRPLPPVTPPPAPGIEELRPGDRVYVTSLRREGEVIELGPEEAEVRVGTFRVTVPLSELEPRPRLEPAVEEETITITTHGAPDVGMELDLRGLTVDEAAARLDKYLDDVYLAGLPSVRIIHGKGTGALRRYVRKALEHHPLVAEFRPGDRHEGGDGVTVVKPVKRET